MKANEAPEKIYFGTKQNTANPFSGLTHKCADTDIEYTRTDAFIKKALKFFTENFEVEDYNDNIDLDGSPIFNYGRFIEDFKKYMEE